MDILSYRNYDELSSKAAALLVQKINKIITQKGKAVISIPGGRSVAGLLQKLSPQDVDWSKVEIFMIDERVVPIDDKESNFKQVYDLFLKRVNAKSHPFIIEKGVEDYNQQFQRVGAHFDIIVLGVGEDGHIASLFPGHSTMRSGELGFGIEPLSPKAPNERLTVLPQSIRQSNTMLLFAVGESKQMAYTLFLTAKDDKMCPALLVHQVRKGFVFTDLKA